jgi:hypothetical protein
MDHTVALAELLSRHGFHRHALLKNQVGHLQLRGQLQGRPIDLMVDTGAASTVLDVAYCRSAGISLRDTGAIGGGAGSARLAIYAVDRVSLSLDGRPLRSDGIYALDLTYVNESLTMKGASPVHGILGQDVLTRHQAVIDYPTMSLFLNHEA